MQKSILNHIILVSIYDPGLNDSIPVTLRNVINHKPDKLTDHTNYSITQYFLNCISAETELRYDILFQWA